MEPQILISIFALVISAMALHHTWKSFFELNRPIVTAEIQTHSSGNIATSYTLMVHNVGNRPACEIRLLAKQDDIRDIINCKADEEMTKGIYRCFSDDGVIPILHSGKSTKNSFGASSTIEKENVFVYQSRLPIEVTYRDLNRAKYKSKLTLIVKDSGSFAGTSWE